MNKDNVEGAVRSTVGHYDEVVGKTQSALGSAKDAVANGVDAASSIDLSGIRDEIARLTQTVTDLIQKQTSTARDQVMDAVGAAGDNISHSAAVAQDKLVSLEADVGARIQKNPWSAVAIAALVGLLVGKMS
jgi:ElaB/YqjD/DUF883 family membrane-anchored ribosome-binding protein